MFADRLRRPLDGRGLLSPTDPDLAALRGWAARQWRGRAAWGLGGVIAVATRLVSPVAVVAPVLRFARRFALGPMATARLLADCWAGGAQPNEAFVWRRFLGPPGVHPLPGRAAGLLFPHLGDLKTHRLLADKIASGQFFAAAGLPTPPVLAMVARGEGPDFSNPLWMRPGRLIAKPRHGAAGQGILAFDTIDGAWFDVGGAAVAPAEMARRLRLLAKTDDLLIQERLAAAADMEDLAAEGRSAVLRLTTARAPGGAPFLHSALLEIDVPGESPGHFIRGRLRAPIDPETGVMHNGLWFLHPQRRFPRLPWNGALLAGRVTPGFDAAAGHVLQAATLLPGLPLAVWDVIITAAGPKILEGNSAGDWVLTELHRCAGLHPPPLAPLLRRWVPS